MSDTSEPGEAILGARIEASFYGLDLGPLGPVNMIAGGYEAKCRVCGERTGQERPGTV